MSTYTKWGGNSFLGQSEYVMQALTLIGVIYLVYKTAKIHISLSGMHGNSNYLRYLQGMDSQNYVSAIDSPGIINGRISM